MLPINDGMICGMMAKEMHCVRVAPIEFRASIGPESYKTFSKLRFNLSFTSSVRDNRLLLNNYFFNFIIYKGVFLTSLYNLTIYSLITPNEKRVMPDNNTRKAINVVKLLGVPTNNLKYIK